MTDPTHALHVPGKGRHYRHPRTGEQWPSVTNVLDFAVAKHNLVPWAAKITAEKAWDELPRMVALSRKPDQGCAKKKPGDRCGNCSFCLLSEIKAEIKVVRDTAADLGTRVHAQAEAMVLGRPIGADAEAEPFVKQLLRFWNDFDVNISSDFEAVEATVINRAFGYAGTLDCLMWLTIDGHRRLVLIDYKSSLTRPAAGVYPENGMQVAALAHAKTVLFDDGTEQPMPGPIDSAYVLNLRVDDYALMPMPVAGTLSDAFTAFCGALADAKYLIDCYGAKPVPVTPPKNSTMKGQAA